MVHSAAYTMQFAAESPNAFEWAKKNKIGGRKEERPANVGSSGKQPFE